MNRDDTMALAIALLALYLLSRSQPAGAVAARIYGASVAPGVDVIAGGALPPAPRDPNDHDLADDGREWFDDLL